MWATRPRRPVPPCGIASPRRHSDLPEGQVEPHDQTRARRRSPSGHLVAETRTPRQRPSAAPIAMPGPPSAQDLPIDRALLVVPEHRAHGGHHDRGQRGGKTDLHQLRRVIAQPSNAKKNAGTRTMPPPTPSKPRDHTGDGPDHARISATIGNRFSHFRHSCHLPLTSALSQTRADSADARVP
jgi:hypothetical protein